MIWAYARPEIHVQSAGNQLKHFQGVCECFQGKSKASEEEVKLKRKREREREREREP